MEPQTLHMYTEPYFICEILRIIFRSDPTTNSNFHEFYDSFNTLVCLLLFRSSKTIQLVKKKWKFRIRSLVMVVGSRARAIVLTRLH